MARKIWWTSLALDDLVSIREFIRRDKPVAAKKEAQRIKKSTERLSSFPESGRKLQKIPTVREVISGSYHIFYRCHGGAIEILRVLHGRRNIPWIP